VDGELYAIGGSEQQGKQQQESSTLTLRYDPMANSWQEMAALPHRLSHAGVASLDGKIYAIGGFTDAIHIGPQHTAYVYDPRTNHWSDIPPLAQARGSIAVTAVDGKIHIFGGRTSSQITTIPGKNGAPALQAGFGTVNTHEVYDPATNLWSSAAPIPGQPRDHMGIAVVNGKVHLFGGRVADVTDNLARHDVYDPATDRWTTAAPLPKPRSSGAYTVLDGRIVYAGGECKPGGAAFTPNVFDDVTEYDPATDHWTTLIPLPRARHAFGAATIGDTAYFVGGAPLCGGGTSTSVFALTQR